MRLRALCGGLAAALLFTGCEYVSPLFGQDPAALEDGEEVDPEGGPPPEATAEASDALPYAPDKLIVQLQPDVADDLQRQIAEGRSFDELQWPDTMKQLNQLYGATAVAPTLPPDFVSPQRLAMLREEYARRHPAIDTRAELPRLDAFFTLTVDPSGNLAETAMAYDADEAVLSAELDLVAHISTADTWGNAIDQWGLFKLNAPAVWASSTGLGINVAVIDTGVDLTHPDLAANVLPGASYVPFAPTPQDDNGHGSHVAGIIAAIANNSQGIAGAAPGAKIIPVKALNSGGSGQLSWLSTGYAFALGTGTTDVINNSWGGAGWSPLFDSLIHAGSLMGIITINASGNNNAPTYGFFPSNVEYGLSIASTTGTDVRASYSNTGIKLDVAAPGGASSGTFANGILSTVPPFFAGAGTVVDLGAKYSPLAGTSMAAPHASALAALLYAAHPTWTVEQLRQAIRKGSQDVDAAGFDANTGYGRVWAPGSMALAQPPSSQIISPRNDEAVYGTAVPVNGYSLATPSNFANWQLFASPGTSMTSWTLVGSGGAGVNDAPVTTFNSTAFADGPLVLRLVTTNIFGGMSSEDRNLVNIQNVRITSPVNGQHLTSPLSVNVLGRVLGTGAVSWNLSWAPGYNAATGFTVFATGGTQIPANTLIAPWPQAPVPEGEISLKLTATFPSGTRTHQINVVVDKYVMPGWPVPINDPMGQKTPKIVDLDNDGQMELVVGASVYRPNGTLKPGWNAIPGPGRTVPGIANVNANAAKEVVVALFGSYFYDPSLPNNGATVITAYNPNKTVLWTYPVLQTTGTYHNGTPSSVSIGNVQGDGKLEVVFTMFFAYSNPTAATTVFILDAGTGALINRFNVPGFSWSSVALADLNHDGYRDLVFETYNNATSQGLVHAMKPNGTYLTGWPQVSPSNQGFADIAPVIGDVNNDCTWEVLVGTKLYKENGTAYTGWPVPYIGRSTGVIANMDTDAPLEIGLGGGNSVSSWYMENNGLLNLGLINSFENLYVFGFNENYKQGHPLVADVDGDNRVDLIRQDELGTTDPFRAIPIYVYDLLTSAKKAQTRRVHTTEPGGAYNYPAYSTAAIGDLNGNGKLDIAVVAQNLVWVWDMGVNYVPSKAPWPMYQRDLFNTGTVPLGVACPVLPDPNPPNPN